MTSERQTEITALLKALSHWNCCERQLLCFNWISQFPIARGEKTGKSLREQLGNLMYCFWMINYQFFGIETVIMYMYEHFFIDFSRIPASFHDLRGAKNDIMMMERFCDPILNIFNKWVCVALFPLNKYLALSVVI